MTVVGTGTCYLLDFSDTGWVFLDQGFSGRVPKYSDFFRTQQKGISVMTNLGSQPNQSI